MLSNLAPMASIPTPVVVDQITGLRVNIIHWVEFAPLCFVMSFLLLENVDAPMIPNPPRKWRLAILLGLSTFCGAILLLCRDLTQLLTVFTISWMLFMPLFFKLRETTTRCYTMRAELPSVEGSLPLSAESDEQYQVARVSFYLTGICTLTWTLLALLSFERSDTKLRRDDLQIFRRAKYRIDRQGRDQRVRQVRRTRRGAFLRTGLALPSRRQGGTYTL
jgi:hypothetical protein